MRVVAESMGEALFALDEDGNVAFLNDAGSDLLGWTDGELLGRQLHELVHFQHANGTPFPREECPIMRAREHGEVVRVDDDVFTRRDGTIVPVSYTSAPFVTSGGARGTVVVVRDITRHKAQEQEWLERLELSSWTERIRAALTEDRFVLYAQPIFDLTTGETVQHELLIRMRDERGVLIPPGQFLPSAEESGLIRQIDEWVVGQAAKLVGEDNSVQINLSAASFAQRGMADEIEDAFVAAGADPSRLVVEFTETALLQDELGARRFADRIVELGVRIALDDFGTGYGGFTYLKHLPVHYLKIDREFVRDISVETSSRHVVEAVVNLAKGFGQRTIAEGVERRSKVPILLALGVDSGQGYGLARPFPAAKLGGTSR
jgi:PAS domain S-box-containing protein